MWKSSGSVDSRVIIVVCVVAVLLSNSLQGIKTLYMKYTIYPLHNISAERVYEHQIQLLEESTYDNNHPT